MIEIKTPSGYVVRLTRDYLTYGEKIRIQEIYLKSAKVNPKEASMSEFNPLVVFEAQKETFNIFVKEIQAPDGAVVTEKLYEYVKDMRDEDGQAIFDYLNEMTNPTVKEDSEKKK